MKLGGRGKYISSPLELMDNIWHFNELQGDDTFANLTRFQ